jgi:hypothetical protein
MAGSWNSSGANRQVSVGGFHPFVLNLLTRANREVWLIRKEAVVRQETQSNW